jgi:hypothetical protein
MVTELDVYRTAQLLIRQYGADSPIQATMQHDTMLERGDLQGATVWKRVVAAIDVILATDRPDHERLH